jgi:predicted transcriptional regulator
VALYLDPDRVKLLHALAIKTRRTKQHLLREAVDAMLMQHKLLKPKRKP